MHKTLMPKQLNLNLGLTPHAVVALQMYQQTISALYSLRQNFRHFWPLMFLSRFRCIDRSTITDISLL